MRIQANDVSGQSMLPRWRAVGIYLVVITAGNLAWESLQLPLYTLWRTGTPGEMKVPRSPHAPLHSCRMEWA